MHHCICHCNDSKKEKGSQAGVARSALHAGDVSLDVIVVTGAIVHGYRLLEYGQVRGVCFYAVSAVAVCIGMVST